MEYGPLPLSGTDETSRLGTAIGSSALPGDLIYLDGDLGAGKTTLTKSIGSALGIAPQTITSPTFALVHEYPGRQYFLYHFDLYRLQRASELAGIGFDDYLSSNKGILVIEWANLARGHLPEDALRVFLAADDAQADVRWANLSASGPLSLALLERVKGLFTC
jgi:tRNA threonylcarbamoyladenosine biosynthesis protein TsaE